MNKAASERAISPEERRARRRLLVRLALTEALSDYHESQAKCARLTGAPASHVQSWADPEGTRNLSLADAMGLPRRVQAALCRWWANLLGFDLAPQIDATDIRSVSEAIAHASEVQATARACLIRALADGVLDVEEAIGIRATEVTSVEHSQAVIELCNRAERDGGLRVSLVPVQEGR